MSTSLPEPPTTTDTPRWERVMLAGGYFFTMGIGASVIINPPASSLLGALGTLLAIIWAVFILSSGVCIPAVLAGRYKIEYVLIPFFNTALLVAVAATWMKVGADPAIIPRACTGTILIFLFTARQMNLHRLVKASKKLARGKQLWTQR